MTIETSSDLREYFRERLGAALVRHGVPASEGARFYLVELLASFALDPGRVQVGEPFALQLAEAAETSGPERARRLKALGDGALYVCGFFADHLERRGVSRSYVASLGGRAYMLVAHLPGGQVYAELADGFLGYASAFDDVREETALRTPQDLVRLYERWRRTGSPRLAERLREEGVFPQHGKGRVLH
ncbi:MAG: hypothetical protein IT378_08615 [Sandaracinaceae bacterium]|nr:hypothetical protein [Sandaracinaceae bacterium]